MPYVFIFLISFSFSSFAKTNLICPQKIVLGVAGEWPPFVMAKDYSEIKGADIDLIKLIMSRLNCAMEVVSVPAKRVTTELSSGMLTVALGASITDERQKLFYFSEPYRFEVIKLFYQPSLANLASYTNVADMVKSEHLIALNTSGWYGEQIHAIKQSSYKSQLVHVNTMETRVGMLEKGRVEAFIDDELASCFILSKQQRLAIRAHPQTLNKNPVHFMFNKNVVSTIFMERFNQELIAIKNAKEHYTIYQQYADQDCLTTSYVYQILDLSTL